MTKESTFAAAALASLWGIHVNAATAARVDVGVCGLLDQAYPAIAKDFAEDLAPLPVADPMAPGPCR
jgi:hypothetical protein